MKLTATVDLDDLFTDDGWDTKMIGSVIRDELRKVVASEVKAAVKNNKELKDLITRVKSLAIKRALETVKDLE